MIKASEDEIRKTVDTAFWVNFLIALTCSAILAASAGEVGRIIQSSSYASLIYLLCPSIPLAALTSWLEALLIRHGRMKIYFYSQIVSDGSSNFVAALLLLAGQGPFALAGSRLTSVVVNIGLFLLVERRLPRFYFAPGDAKKILGYSGGLYAGAATSYFGRYGADFILGYFLSPTATGIYRLGTRVTDALIFVVQAPILDRIALANLSRVQRNNGPVVDEWLGILLALSVLSWSAMALLAVSAPDIIQVLGDKWLPAVPVIVAQTVGRALFVYTALVGVLLVIRSETRLAFVLGALNTAIFVALLIVVCRYGPVWAAVAQTATAAIMAMISLRVVRRRLVVGGSTIALNFAKGLAAAVIVAVPALLMHWLAAAMGLPPMPRAVLVVGTGAALWFFVVGIVFRGPIQEFLS
jgi:O-antigen/teichoic acid export membrane protein